MFPQVCQLVVVHICNNVYHLVEAINYIFIVAERRCQIYTQQVLCFYEEMPIITPGGRQSKSLFAFIESGSVTVYTSVSLLLFVFCCCCFLFFKLQGNIFAAIFDPKFCSTIKRL